MAVTVNHLQAVDEPAADFRRVLLGTLARSSAITSRDGVLPGGLAVSDGASGMDVVVAPGQAMVSGYLVSNTANATLTLDAGGATTRTDVIALQVLDEESGDASSAGQLVVVKGTSTTEPTLPARSIKLATINVNAGANSLTGSNITDGRTYTGTGSVVWAPGALASAPSSLVNGTLVYDDQADALGVVDGSSWRKFLRDTDVTAAITAAVAARVIETTRSSATVSTQGTWTQVEMLSTGTSVGSGWSTPDGWTQVPVTGWYVITGTASYAEDTDGRRGLRFENAAGTVLGKAEMVAPAPGGTTALPHTVEAWLTAGSQVRMSLFQDSGGSLGVTDLRLTVRLAIVGS